MRIKRPGSNLCVQSVVTGVIGASDATNVIDLAYPGDRAELVGVQACVKTAGVGGGTFSIQIMTGVNDATMTTAIGAASSATFVNSTAAAGVVCGAPASGVPGGFNPLQGRTRGFPVDTGGQHLAVKTVKTGTVTTGVNLQLTLTWEL